MKIYYEDVQIVNDDNFEEVRLKMLYIKTDMSKSKLEEYVWQKYDYYENIKKIGELEWKILLKVI